MFHINAFLKENIYVADIAEELNFSCDAAVSHDIRDFLEVVDEERVVLNALQ